MWRYVGPLARTLQAVAAREMTDFRDFKALWNGYRERPVVRPEMLGCLSNAEIDRLEAGPKTRPKRGRQS